jgi:hypothetical protein
MVLQHPGSREKLKGLQLVLMNRQEARRMSRHRPETPFDNIESSHEYVSLLTAAVAEAISEVEADLALAHADGAARRIEALQLVQFNLAKLNSNMSSSRRILNDLRTLRRLLLEERTLATAGVR